MKNRCFCFPSVLLLVCMTLSLVAGAVDKAPLNPDFLRWRQDKSDAPGAMPAPAPFQHQQGTSVKGTLPARFDLRDAAAMSPVKNQRNCGACWSFAACAVLESNLLRQTGELWDFSENHMKNTHGFLWGPCAGGNNYISLAYLARWTGPLLESNDPYNPNALVLPEEGAVRQKLLLRGLHFSMPASGLEAIKNYVYETGPLSGTMMWRDQDYHSASRTYCYKGSGEAYGHMVTLVGWDDDLVVPGVAGAGAWICKNSWGASWGDNGYFYISYSDTDFLEDAAGFDTLVAPTSYGTLYHYDPFGITGYVGSGVGVDIYGANVFTALQDESIVAVGTYGTADGLSYSIAVYQGGFVNGKITNPVVTTSGSFANAGYHVVELPEAVAVNEGDSFTVVIRYNSSFWGYPMPIEQPISGFSPATAASGQSFLSEDGVFFEDIHQMGGVWRNNNACIKAIAAYQEQEIPEPSVKILGRPQAVLGESASLKAVLSNFAGDRSFAWYHDGVLIANATEQLYQIFDVTMEHEGQYVVQVTDGESAVFISPPFQLTVLKEGSMPLYNTAGLSMMVLFLVTAGAILLRRRSLRVQ